MKKIVVLGILLVSTLAQYVFATPYYVRSTAGSPWGQSNYVEDMNIVFGEDGWVQSYYETIDPNDLFSSGNDFIYMEGSDRNADEMESFISDNMDLMQGWVYAGGTLFLNAAPNEGNGMDMGFGVSLNYRDFSRSVYAVDPDHGIFHEPFGVTGSTFTGTSFAHASVSGDGLNPLLLGEEGQFVLAEKTHGRGVAFFGGMTSRNWHSPKPEVSFLHQNIRSYQMNIIGAALSYQRHVTLTPGEDVDIEITVNNRDDFPIQASISYPHASLNVTGPASLAINPLESDSITVNIASDYIDEGNHSIEVKFELDQGEDLTAQYYRFC